MSGWCSTSRTARRSPCKCDPQKLKRLTPGTIDARYEAVSVLLLNSGILSVARYLVVSSVASVARTFHT